MTAEAADPTAALTVNADHDSAFYWEGAAAGRLLAQRCTRCERLWHPPGPVCPHCQGLDWTVDDLPHHGVVYSAAIVHEPGSPIQGTGYVIALVELADPRGNGHAVRIAGNLRDASLDDAPVGAAVTVHFEELAGDHRLPQFRLDAST